MRPVLICAVLTVCVVLGLTATATKPIPSGLTVILDFRGAHSDPAIHEMERESGAILESTGLKLDWRLRNQTAGQAYSDLVVMTFRGACKFGPVARVYDEFGPLASTTTTNHVIQSFGQVDCDHVVSTARSAMVSSDFKHADLLVGRALGRVVVHELVHMLTHSAEHGRDGVFEAALSGRQLIADTLPLSAMDVDRLVESEQRYALEMARATSSEQ
jgi:hypothetical protein